MEPKTHNIALREAVRHLRLARDHLKAAGTSKRCVDRVRAALASAKGAARHGQNRPARERRAIA